MNQAEYAEAQSIRESLGALTLRLRALDERIGPYADAHVHIDLVRRLTRQAEREIDLLLHTVGVYASGQEGSE